MKVRALLFSVIAIFLLAGCKHGLNESQGEGYVTININTQIEGAVPAALEKAWAEEKENARTAQPVVPEDILYKVSGLKADGGLVSFENSTENTYKLQFGTYSTVSVAGFIKDSADAYTLKAFESTETKAVTISETNPSENLDFILHPFFGTDNGSVSLPVVLEAGCGITKVAAFWTENGSAKSQVLTVSENAATFTMEAVGETDGVKAGVYNVVFAFYKYSGNAEILAYRAVETINVFSNLTTDTWQKAGDSVAYLSDIDADDSLEFYVTLQMIKKFEQLVKYVDQTTGSDANNQGTYFSPFETIQKAVDVIKAQNEDAASDLKGSDFIILLKNDYTDDSTSAYSATNQNALINIASSSEDLNIAISSIDPTSPLSIDANRSAANGTGRVLYVGNKAAVTLEGISITGGYFETGSTNQGVGIYVAPTGTLYLDGKVAVYGNRIGTKDNNLYLPKDTDNSQTVVYIARALESNVQGKIGITTEIKPTAQNLTVTFTESFGSINTLTPSSFFVSDEGYSVGYDGVQAEGVIAVSKGGFEYEPITSDVKIAVDKSIISNNKQTLLYATAALNGTAIEQSEDFNWLTAELKVYDFGVDYSNRVTATVSESDGKYVITFPANTFFTGDYIQVFIKAEYKNRIYSTNAITLEVKTNALVPTAASVSEFVNTLSYGQTVSVAIDSPNPDFTVLKQLVTTSPANIELDLSSCTELTELPKDWLDLNNSSNKLKRIKLSENTTKFVDSTGAKLDILSPDVKGTNGDIDLRYAILYGTDKGTDINVVSNITVSDPIPVLGDITVKAETSDISLNKESLSEVLFTVADAETNLTLGGGAKTLSITGGCYNSSDNTWPESGKGAVTISSGTINLKENCFITDFNISGTGTNDSIIAMNGGTVNIEGATISTFKSGTGQCGSAVRVNRGTLNFSSGMIGNTDFANEGYYGGIYIQTTGTFNMSGTAVISKCLGRYGGGILCRGKFTMTGGTIQECRAWGSKGNNQWGGGAIYSEASAYIDLQAGTFKSNYTSGTSTNSYVTPGGAIHATAGTIKVSSSVVFNGNGTYKGTVANVLGAASANGNHYYINDGVIFYLDGTQVTSLPYKKD